MASWITQLLLAQPKYLGLVAAAIALACIAAQRHRLRARHRLPLPPMPKGWPLVGNALEFLPAAQQGRMHLLVHRWAQAHGEIVRVQIGPTMTNYYLNSDRAVKALLEKQSAATSERPRWIMASELLCNKWNVLLLNGSDPRWKLQRKVTHSEMTSVPMADAGVPYLHYETAKFLHEAAHDPTAGTPAQRASLWKQLGRYTYSTFAQQSFGFSVDSVDDPAIDYIHQSGVRSIEATLPGAALIDIFPLLDRLPLWLKPWERQARAYFRQDIDWCRQKLQELRRTTSRQDGNSLLLRILRDEKRLGLSCDDEAAFLSLELIIGAADTSQISTWAFMEAMLMFPAVQAEAQAEMDRLVGDRIPTWDDFVGSQYLRALQKEVWRFRPPVTMGHPHITTRDLEYEGMRVPRGARIFLNAWAIHHDPRRHPDPDTFSPQRYMDDPLTTAQSINLADPTKRDHYAFGAGRRVCPGYNVAERSLAVAMMRILWAFDIKVASDAKLPLNTVDYRSFMPGSPGETMPVCVTVRDQNKLRLIDEAWAAEKKKKKW